MLLSAKILVLVALSASLGEAVAQPACTPVVRVLHGNLEIPATGSALLPRVTLQVTPDAACPNAVRYQFRSAELTLVRRGRPLLPAIRAHQPQVDFTAWMQVYEPGDRIHIFIPYQHVVMVTANGVAQLYQPPTQAQVQGKKFDLRTDQAKGISFNWLLTQK
ncbi:hypothetical protein MTX78_07225 [Hymenobacter tibetensis]|uniref:Uncharacterized protein n=1 Tax=Hymenobacter tibetensis TaxID=497967 RepID=A0ABY4D1I4_9BACT|nr:hypothetical protein [Hymenobacter tibetensis]UOG76383.1 hypothetical protein MTX78_07225 [Hymenobacter tibetensis]